MSIFDWVTSLLGAWVIGAFLLRLVGPLQWVLWLAFWVLFGIITHAVLGVPTMLGYYLGINAPPRR